MVDIFGKFIIHYHTRSALAAIPQHPFSRSSILKSLVQGKQEKRLQLPTPQNNTQYVDQSKDAR